MNSSVVIVSLDQTRVQISPSNPIDLNSTTRLSSPKSGAFPIPPPSNQNDKLTLLSAVIPPNKIFLEVRVSAHPCGSLLLNIYGYPPSSKPSRVATPMVGGLIANVEVRLTGLVSHLTNSGLSIPDSSKELGQAKSSKKGSPIGALPPPLEFTSEVIL